ncbi:MAG: DUF1295 domain-containing protein [Deltaproteobacteria bacterium]|nr:DUF1295 domain-containing protein [Deltaproteobacteria bacterium]
MHGEYGKSVPQKIALALSHVATVVLAGYFLFRQEAEGDFLRRVLLFSCALIYFLRLSVTLFYLMRRRMRWSEALSVAGAFFIFSVGISYAGRNTRVPVGGWDWIAALFYLFGSFLNTGSELQRHWWKMRAENKGKLYTEGLFSWARHINYFGDTVLLAGWVILSRQGWAGLIPLLVAAGFVFFHIPVLTRYLQNKYKGEFEAYALRTKKFIPFFY